MTSLPLNLANKYACALKDTSMPTTIPADFCCIRMCTKLNVIKKHVFKINNCPSVAPHLETRRALQLIKRAILIMNFQGEDCKQTIDGNRIILK